MQDAKLVQQYTLITKDLAWQSSFSWGLKNDLEVPDGVFMHLAEDCN